MAENQMGEFLAALRKSKGYTQQEVAERLGVSNKTVSSWETGASCPDISMLPVLAELYGVTCDEIIRGKRLSPQEAVPEKREKAMERLYRKQRTDLATTCWIAGGLTALGILLCSLIGYAALESLIGFFIGLIFLAASVVTAAVCIRRLRFALGEETASKNALSLRLALDRAMFWLCFANITAFGFLLLHTGAPAHTGLSFNIGNLLIQLLIAAVFAGVTLAVGLPILQKRQKKLLFALETNEEAAPLAEAAAKDLKLTKWRFKHISLTIVLPFVCLAIVTGVLLGCYATWQVGLVNVYTFTTTHRSIGTRSGPFSYFSSNEYTLVDEEMPSIDKVTGSYDVVYLFKHFPEEYLPYYHTEETDEGTLCTIKKYRVEADDGNIIEFYAYEPEYQGGLSDIHAEKMASMNDYYITVTMQPNLAVQREVEKQQLIQMLLGIGAAVFAVLSLGSLGLTIPLYIKRERKFKKTL